MEVEGVERKVEVEGVGCTVEIEGVGCRAEGEGWRHQKRLVYSLEIKVWGLGFGV